MLLRRVALTIVLITSAVVAAGAPQTAVAKQPYTPTFHGLAPARLLETRPGLTTVDGADNGGGPLGPGASRDVLVLSRGGVPASGVDSVALNVTATNPTAASFISVYATGAVQPFASNLNTQPGQTSANMVIVKVGSQGKVRLFNNAGTTDLIVDVLGWFPDQTSSGANAYTGITPARLLETRPGLSTTDGQFNGIGAVGTGATLDVVVAGRGGVPATGVDSVALNVTAAGATASTYVTAFPTGAPQPTASNLNVGAGQVVPNMVIVKLGTGGKISLFNNAGTTDLLVDVLGWFPTDGLFTGLSPQRLLETRPGLTTADGQFNGVGPVLANGTLALTIAGRSGVPAQAGAVALNVTVASATATGFITIFPSGASQPTASNLNFTPAGAVANMVLVPLGTDGKILLFNSAGSTDLVVDVLGWFPKTEVPATTTLVSKASFSAPSNGTSQRPSVSADGRYVVFDSIAGNLVNVDGLGHNDVFVRDRIAGTTKYVSVSTGGTLGNADSDHGVISADGRFVAFVSAATNLAGGGASNDIFLRDLVNQTTTLVSTGSLGAGNLASSAPAISSTGRYVAFSSQANNLIGVGTDTNAQADVFRRDTVSNTTIRVSVSDAEAEATGGASNEPAISADGNTVAFTSAAANLVPSDLNGFGDIFVRDVSGGTTKRVSLRSNNTEAHGGSAQNPTISGDGRFVAFQSLATDMVSDDFNGVADIFHRDLAAQVTLKITYGINGAQPNGGSIAPAISQDGRYIAFSSDANNLVTGDAGGHRDIFLFDTKFGDTVLIPRNSFLGTQANNSSNNAALSADGHVAVFDSDATNLYDFWSGSDSNAKTDVFVYTLGSN